jgi:SMC interacting uncharacterized protein involved in chromosome segregation
MNTLAVLTANVTAENWQEVRAAVNEGFTTVNAQIDALRAELAEVDYYGHAERPARPQTLVEIHNTARMGLESDLAFFQNIHAKLRVKQREFMGYCYNNQ